MVGDIAMMTAMTMAIIIAVIIVVEVVAIIPMIVVVEIVALAVRADIIQVNELLLIHLYIRTLSGTETITETILESSDTN